MRTALCLALSFICFSSWSQEGGHPLLDSFTLRQVGNTIQIDFAIIGGASCNGVKVERSSDDESFYIIDEIQGICGGSEFTEHYTIVDEDPRQYATNHYRLVLGNQGNSVSRSITFVQLDDAYRVFPNPIVDWAVIRFDNPTEQSFTFSVYTLSGGLKDDTPGIKSNEIYLDMGHYSPGTYIFQLMGSDGTLITGKFIKL